MENSASSSLIGLKDNSCSDVDDYDHYDKNEKEDGEVTKDKRGILSL